MKRLLIGLLISGAPAVASARLALTVEGPGARDVEERIDRIVRGTSTVSPLPSGFGARLAGKERGDLAAEMRQAASGHSVALAALTQKGGAVHLFAVEVATGKVLVDRSVAPAKKGKKKTPDPLRAALAPVLKALEQPPPGPEPVRADAGGTRSAGPDWGEAPSWSGASKSSGSAAAMLSSPSGAPPPPRADSVATASASPRSGHYGEAALIAQPYYAFAGRRLTYDAATTPNLRPYKAAGISMVGARAALFPGAFAGGGPLSQVGLSVEYGRALLLSSKPEDDGSLEVQTTFDELLLELAGRLPLEAHTVELGVGYGRQRFLFDLPAGHALAGEVPEVDYSFLRLGAGGRFALGPLSVSLAAAYRLMLGSGAIGETYFPGSTASGIDGRIGFGLSLGSGLEARLSGTVARTVYDLKPRADGLYAARGATDLMWGGQVGMSLWL